MRPLSTSFLLCALVLFAFQGIGSAQVTILHDFTGTTDDGNEPRSGALISDGSALYGMTYLGGANDSGVIFRVNPDGSGFGLLHSFAGGAADGANPEYGLILNGSVLYGMTTNGGASGGGVIFKIDTDGSGFELLHSFAGGTADGEHPAGSLILNGGALYGMTKDSGVSDRGVIFKINTDGSGFELLHSFAGGTGDGDHPMGSLTLDGATLYGMTAGGGASNSGVIFKINTDGSGFETLREFAGGPSDGRLPFGDLLLIGSTLFGTTVYGGANLQGVIFRVHTDGSDYELLHEFTGATDDGGAPSCALIYYGSALYGAAISGGAHNHGTIYRINTNGSGFETLHDFIGATDDGSQPGTSLLLQGARLYGMTHSGGASDLGVIFSLELPTTDAQPIPTLSEWGVIILAALLALVAVAVISRKALKPRQIA